jgi:hypothetical protein
MTRSRPTPADAPAEEISAAVPVVIDRNDCGFGPCPITDCDWGNWGDLPVCRQHYNAHMAPMYADPDDTASNSTPATIDPAPAETNQED